MKVGTSILLHNFEAIFVNWVLNMMESQVELCFEYTRAVYMRLTWRHLREVKIWATSVSPRYMMSVRGFALAQKCSSINSICSLRFVFPSYSSAQSWFSLDSLSMWCDWPVWFLHDNCSEDWFQQKLIPSTIDRYRRKNESLLWMRICFVSMANITIYFPYLVL